MTEAEWLVSEDLLAMMKVFPGTLHTDRFSVRVRRLFAVACARRVWKHLVSDRSRAAVELSEHAADDAVVAKGLTDVAVEADEAVYDLNELPENDPRIWAAYAASHGSKPELHYDDVFEVGSDSGLIGERGREAVADLFREVAGNPFRPIIMPPDWLTPSVRCLAQAAYDERHLPSGELEAARLAILADALEEAGCTDADLLVHLRSPGPHVRGCWALDLILGKQ
jgi:hypothetical protein